MNQNKFSFQSQKLKVDFLTFSFSMKYFNTQKFAKYFFESHGFNCFVSEGNSRRYVQTLFYDPKTKDTLIIRLNYWKQIVVEFPGTSGQKLYQLAKLKSVNWEFFYLASLTRIDLCFDYKKTPFFDPLIFDKFLLKSREQILRSIQIRTKNIKLINNSRGPLLGINKRSNPRHFRVYERTKHIRFELELKSSALSKVHKYLFSSEFELFEENLTKLYFSYAKTLFPLDGYFVDWLLDFSRKYSLSRNQNNNKSLVIAEYLSETNHLLKIEDNEQFYHIMQFLNFIKTLNRHDCSLHFLEGRKYFIQDFYIKDFMNFIGIPNTKQNQRTKIREYFQKLHKTEPITEQFSDGTFRLFATFLYSGVDKISNRWRARVYIIEDLYNYKYPFILSTSFLNYKNKTNCLLKIQIIKSICVENPQKTFQFSKFIKQLKLSNHDIMQIKQDLISLIQEIAEQGIIERKIEIVSINRKIQHVDQQELNLTKIRRIKCLVFYEKLE